MWPAARSGVRFAGPNLGGDAVTQTGRVVIVSNVKHYAGPPVAAALAADGFTVLCHDGSFGDAAAREAFEATHPGCKAESARNAEELVAEALSRFGRLDVVVSNDIHVPKQVPIDMATAELFRGTIEDLLVAPFRVAAPAAAAMIKQPHGHIVLVTYAPPLRPNPGFSQ
jgi:NAD(P)-dependent dehydrogenase (short-subunit alcohol dehydrogenase family)